MHSEVSLVTLGQCPAFVIFLCFLSAGGCSAGAHAYDCCNGMWGETDDEKNWNSLPAVLMPAIPVFTPAVLQNILRVPRLEFC